MISWFWAAVILAGTIRHLVHTLNLNRTRSRPRSSDGAPDQETLSLKPNPTGLDRASLYLRRFVTVPATFGHRCLQNIGWCTIPPRIESLIILLYFVLNVFFCVYGYYVFVGNL